MNTEARDQLIEKTVRGAQIIAFALLVGVLTFSGIAYFLVNVAKVMGGHGSIHSDDHGWDQRSRCHCSFDCHRFEATNGRCLRPGSLPNLYRQQDCPVSWPRRGMFHEPRGLHRGWAMVVVRARGHMCRDDADVVSVSNGIGASVRVTRVSKLIHSLTRIFDRHAGKRKRNSRSCRRSSR